MNWLAGMSIAASLIVMPAVVHAESQPVDNKAEAQRLATDWMNAYNKGDAAAIAKMYTDDAVFSNAAWTASGRPAIEDALNKDLAAGGFKFTSIAVDQSQRIGDMSYARGTWTADMKDTEGKNVPVDGHWLIVSKCDGDTCLARVHNGNMTMPSTK
jgi:uncharacterized protein (TIGR02246 family)